MVRIRFEENMDPIDVLINGNKKFSLQALVNAHSILSVLQVNKGGLTFEDVMQSLSMSGLEFSTTELNGHAALVYESALSPTPSPHGRLSLQMNRDIVANEATFLKSILHVLYSHCGGMEHPLVEEFNMEVFIYLKHSPSSAPVRPTEIDYRRPCIANFTHPRGPVHSSYASHSPAMSSHNVRTRFHHEPRRSPSSSFVHVSQQGLRSRAEEEQRLLGRIEFEKSEPIVRLLAQVRKVGMDILFPQSTHDKILACILVAICSASTPAHRELIDMVMAVRESQSVGQLEGVSKTKVRGVLALLKHGELLITQGSEGEPVRLFLAPGITSFRDLREKHDAFLNRYMAEHHLFIPAVLKSELVWQVDEEMHSQRLDAMNRLVQQLQLFFKGYTGCDGEDSTTVDSRSGETSLPLTSTGLAVSPPESSATGCLSDSCTDWEAVGKNTALVMRKQLQVENAPVPNTAFNSLRNFPSQNAVNGQHSLSPSQGFLQQPRPHGHSNRGDSFVHSSIGNRGAPSHVLHSHPPFHQGHKLQSHSYAPQTHASYPDAPRPFLSMTDRPMYSGFSGSLGDQWPQTMSHVAHREMTQNFSSLPVEFHVDGHPRTKYPLGDNGLSVNSLFDALPSFSDASSVMAETL